MAAFDAVVFNLRSDTCTRPTAAVRAAMANAVVGDDAHGDCPTVKALEARGAALVGMEAAVFVPSGTMGNLASIMAHCAERGAELVCGDHAHILHYAMCKDRTITLLHGGCAALAGALVRAVPHRADGSLALDDVARASGPRTAVVCVENALCHLGGLAPPLAWHAALCAQCAARAPPCAVHLDGARLFDACAALGCAPRELGACADSLTFCLSKGLGAPVGSLVCGGTAFCAKVRDARKMLGGTMHQCGVLAAAGLEVLKDEHVSARAVADAEHARRLAAALDAGGGGLISVPARPQTNMIYARTAAPAARVVEEMERRGVLAFAVEANTVRLICHLEIEAGAVETIATRIIQAAGAVGVAAGEDKRHFGKKPGGAAALESVNAKPIDYLGSMLNIDTDPPTPSQQ